jgi:uncharacterized protein (DUF433 family)
MNTRTTSVISVDPEVMHGKPVFEGTHVPIAAFYVNLKGGVTIEEFLNLFPSVQREHINRLFEEQLAELASGQVFSLEGRLNMYMETQSVISIDPEVMHGAPVFAGTRVTIAAFYDNIRDGLSIK